eukprot:Gb_16570 [translate_table: standard]
MQGITYINGEAIHLSHEVLSLECKATTNRVWKTSRHVHLVLECYYVPSLQVFVEAWSQAIAIWPPKLPSVETIAPPTIFHTHPPRHTLFGDSSSKIVSFSLDASWALSPRSFYTFLLECKSFPYISVICTAEGSGVSFALESTSPNIVSIFIPSNMSNMVSKSWTSGELYLNCEGASVGVFAFAIVVRNAFASVFGPPSENISSKG